MFVKVSAVLVLLAVTTVHAGFFDDVQGVSSDVGNFFSNQFQNAKDLFSNDQSELEKNVERVKEMLTGLKGKLDHLKQLANDSQKETLNKVDEFLTKVNKFQEEVKKDGAEKFEENKGKWNQMVNDIFEKGEIKSILQLTKNSVTSSFLTATIAPIFYMIFVR